MCIRDSNREEYSDTIEQARNKYVANLGKSAQVSGKYIIQRLIEKQKKAKEKEL